MLLTRNLLVFNTRREGFISVFSIGKLSIRECFLASDINKFGLQSDEMKASRHAAQKLFLLLLSARVGFYREKRRWRYWHALFGKFKFGSLDAC